MKRAVEMLDALLAGSTEPMHWTLPTELEIRQSCGCFGNLSELRELRISGLPAQTTLDEARRALEDVLVTAAGNLSKSLPDDWASLLIDAFGAELDGQCPGAFGDKLGEWVVRAKPFGTITSWHYILGRFRDAIVDRLAGNAWLRAEPLFQNAHILVGEHAARAQGERLMDRERVVLLLDEAAVESRTAVDLPALENALARHLPGLGVPSFYVALGGADAGSPSEQVMAFDEGRTLPPWQRGRYGTAIGRAVHAVLQFADLATGSDIPALATAQAAAEGVLGNDRVKVFPPREMVFEQVPEDEPKIATYKAKWDDKYRKRWGIKNKFAVGLPEDVLKKIERQCKKVHSYLYLRGYARFDLRLTPENEVVFLEANPNPSELKIREAMNGHLCRCGTYNRIVKAIQAAARKSQGG